MSVSFIIFNEIGDFSVKSKSIFSLFQYDFRMTTVWDYFCYILEIEFLMNSGSKAAKGLRRSILVWNYVKRLTFRIRTADGTYCSDVTHFLHATSGGLSPTVAFSLCRFLALYALKFIRPHFLGTKLRFYPILCPWTHLRNTEIHDLDYIWQSGKVLKTNLSHRQLALL